jgi:hypothetical protein
MCLSTASHPSKIRSIGFNMLLLLLLLHVWVRIGNWFIGYLQVVTTNNYNTVTDFHTTKHSTLISSVYLH